MISVGDISALEYCARKLYARRRCGYEEERSEAMRFGICAHNVMRAVLLCEPQVLEQVCRSDTPQDISKKFHYVVNPPEDEPVRGMIERQLGEFNMDRGGEIYTMLTKNIWDRSQFIYRYMRKHQIEGARLKEGFWPRNEIEKNLRSDALGIRGRADRVLVMKNRSRIPIEMKTGRSRNDGGAWKADRLQVGAYAMMLREYHPCTHGFVHYVMSGQKVKVPLSEYLEDEVLTAIEDVHEILAADAAPTWGCGSCEPCKTPELLVPR